MSEVKRNITYALMLTGSRFLFPLLTFPYLSRVLGPEKIGLLNFSESYSSCFVLISALGIPLYGVREVAKVRHNQDQLNKVFTEISIIYFISTILCTAVFLISIFSIHQLEDQLMLNLLFGLNILVSFASFEWFLIGIEKFKYLAIRSILTKLIPIILMFFIVKDSQDYLIYQVLSISAFLCNALANLFLLRKYVSINTVSLNLKKHLSPLVSVFFSSVFLSFYSIVDSFILGLLKDYKSVGFYASAVKLNRIACLIIASIGNVLVPRISNLISLGYTEKVVDIIDKSMRLTILTTVPISFGLFLISEELIIILFGAKFENSILPSQILSPIVFLIGLSNVFTIQILLPFSKERILVTIFLMTTLISIILNLILADKLDYEGSAYATVLTEIVLTIMSFNFARKVLPIHIPWKHLFTCLIISVLFIPIVLAMRSFSSNAWIITIFSGIFCSLIYGLVQLVFFKDHLTREILLFFKNTVKEWLKVF